MQMKNFKVLSKRYKTVMLMVCIKYCRFNWHSPTLGNTSPAASGRAAFLSSTLKNLPELNTCNLPEDVGVSPYL